MTFNFWSSYIYILGVGSTVCNPMSILCIVLGIELRASCWVGRHSTAELHSQPHMVNPYRANLNHIFFFFFG